MTSALDAKHIETQARALVDSRMNSIRSLVTTRQALAELRAQVGAAEAQDVKAYRAALGDGWTADELRRIGLDEPAKKARARKRTAARREPSAVQPGDE